MNSKILSTAQIRAWDAHTIAHLPISSLDLMENASRAFVGKFVELYDSAHEVLVVCGIGNNGGDGLAIGRILQEMGYQVSALVVRHSSNASADFTINFERAKDIFPITEVQQIEALPTLPASSTVIIDAILGSGLHTSLRGLVGKVVNWINETALPVVAVDIASGLFADLPTPFQSEYIIKPTHTIAFEVPKLAFLLPQNAPFVGEWHIVPIGLEAQYGRQVATDFQLLTPDLVGKILKKRPKFGHKGTFGHSLLIGGSYGKIGAMVLATRACLHSGTGLATAYIPQIGYQILQTAVPEAMCLVDNEAHFIRQFPDIQSFQAIGVGMGLGTKEASSKAFFEFLKQAPSHVVIDADALNILGMHKEMLEYLPAQSILTPHPKEFERLTRPTSDNFERLEILRNFAQTYQVYVLLKGAHTALATPEGKVYFNNTGNSGMATGGSGDVLTGIITGFLAQGYKAFEASALGMYVHGLAGDLAISMQAPHALTASDLITHIGKALQILSQNA